MSNDDRLLGTIMREARIRSHITQEELAEKSPCKPYALRKYRTWHKQPKFSSFL